MRDFTLNTYISLLKAFQAKGYVFATFSEYCSGKISVPYFVILRHDVDALPQNSLRLAQLENSLGIRGTYYFRTVPGCYDETVIAEIYSLGHEIGYHYETVATINEKKKVKIEERKVKYGDCNQPEMIDEAFMLFVRTLEMMRKIVPVETICMHGSPLSKYDNKAIWEKYDYHSLGIVGEPYLDTDFNQVAYFTDTGRRWNGTHVSIRDKVEGTFQFNFRSTHNIIRNVHLLPPRIMITIHPQRWADSFPGWFKEWIFQNMKNPVKWSLLKMKKKIRKHGYS
jgi:hypothetical protein